jgi:nucleoside diphosphate kinase
MERTLSIVKPDGVERDLIGEVVRHFETAGIRVIALKMVRLDAEQARGFYHVHRERPFFASLVSFMTSGPIVPMVLEPRRIPARYVRTTHRRSRRTSFTDPMAPTPPDSRSDISSAPSRSSPAEPR